MTFIELPTIHRHMYSMVNEWNKEDDRITILTLKALQSHILRPLMPKAGIATAIMGAGSNKFLGLSWTLKLVGKWRSATIVDHSIRGHGYGSALFRFKVALFTDRVGEEFPEVILDPNNKASYAMVAGVTGIKIKPNPERKEI